MAKRRKLTREKHSKLLNELEDEHKDGQQNIG
jgi:hypothetical protein